MGRVHLFELEDQPWFPPALRRYMTDYLDFAGRMSDAPLARFAERLAPALRRTGATRIVDLCSGSGGPVPRLLQILEEAHGLKLEAVLTDLYPHPERHAALGVASGGAMKAHPIPVDATAVPPDLGGFRLVSNGFHHFPPPQAKAILRDAVAAGEGIAIVELVERRPAAVLSMLMIPIVVLLATAWLRPVTVGRLFWTWVVPLVPLLVMFDGVVSCLRVYSPQELRALTSDLPAYEWAIGREPIRGLPAGITYLVGWPKGPGASGASPSGA